VVMGLSPEDGELVGVLVRRNAAREGALPVYTDLGAFLRVRPEVVLEAAGPAAFALHAEAIVATGATLISVSASALMDAQFRDRLESLCAQHGTRVYFPSGALGGLDALGAAAVGELTGVALTVTEPGDPARQMFSGVAVDGVREYPSRLNVAALTALLAARSVQLEFDQQSNTHALTLAAHGAFGDFACTLRPRPQADRLSHIVALSLLATLRQLRAPLTFA
jgi:aspartate dehydrogenase